MILNNFTTTDKSIRRVLLSQLTQEYKNNRNTVIVPEFTLPNASARVDIAVINGIMHGYELKSDIDNLLRLSSQKDSYNLIFDKITLVVGKSHLVGVLNLIPDWWGITIAKITVDSTAPILIPLRKAQNNPTQDMLTIANILWKDEAITILEKLGEYKRLKNKPKTYICQKLIHTLKECDLKKYVKRSLINRMSSSCYRPALG